MLGYIHTRNYSFILYYIIWMSWYQNDYLKFLVSGTAAACMRIVYLSTGTSTLLPPLSWVNEGDWSWLVVFLYMYYTFISYMRVYEISIRRHTYNVCSSLFMNVAWQWCITFVYLNYENIANILCLCLCLSQFYTIHHCHRCCTTRSHHGYCYHHCWDCNHNASSPVTQRPGCAESTRHPRDCAPVMTSAPPPSCRTGWSRVSPEMSWWLCSNNWCIHFSSNHLLTYIHAVISLV